MGRPRKLKSFKKHQTTFAEITVYYCMKLYNAPIV